jgi:hypothetical protein
MEVIQPRFRIALLAGKLLACRIGAVTEGRASDSDACGKLFAEGGFGDVVSSRPKGVIHIGLSFSMIFAIRRAVPAAKRKASS